MFGGSKAICARYGVPESFASMQSCTVEEKRARAEFESAGPVLEQVMKKVSEAISDSWTSYQDFIAEHYGDYNLANLPLKSTAQRDEMIKKSIATGGFLTMLVPNVKLTPAKQKKIPPGHQDWPKLEQYPWALLPPVVNCDNPMCDPRVKSKIEKGIKDIAAVARHIKCLIECENPVMVIMAEGADFNYNNGRPYALTQEEASFWGVRANDATFKRYMQDIWEAAPAWSIIPSEVLINRPKYGYQDELKKALAAKRVADTVATAGGGYRSTAFGSGIEVVSRHGLKDTVLTVKDGKYVLGRDGQPLPKARQASSQPPQPGPSVADSDNDAANNGIQFAFDDFVPDVPVPSTSYEPAPVVAEQPAKKQRGKKADAEPATKKAQTKAAAAKQIELTLPSSAAAAATAAAVYEAALPPAKRSRKGTTVVEQSAAAVAVSAVAAARVCNVTECAGQANWMCGVQACMKSLSYWCFMHQHHASHCNMQFRIPIEQTVESGFLNPGTTPQEQSIPAADPTVGKAAVQQNATTEEDDVAASACDDDDEEGSSVSSLPSDGEESNAAEEPELDSVEMDVEEEIGKVLHQEIERSYP